mmetsp:Transcript_7381/g.21822  ORF Transcript_7381/g.21822 Transcript_7381/m.21822 type:complete len:132 (+) Transcript_7381:173-568(+)
MDKITTSERNRVVAIMEDAVERLMLLSYVPETAHEAVLGELEAGPYEVFQTHWDLERRAQREDLSAELADSSRAVCRCLRDSPRAFATLQRYVERNEANLQFVAALVDLKNMFGRKLAKTNEDEARRASRV